ncbi:MAG: gamma-glutamyltransferase [Pseudomonadota bacterium]
MAKKPAKGVVAAGHRLTAEAGVDVLRQGGTAADAAIAALAMACVAEPVLCSPGGAGFAMLRDGATGEVSLVDFFAQTPMRKRARAADGVNEVVVDFGPATSAAPGFWAGIEYLHLTGGTISLAELVKPAVDAARAGIEVTPYQHYLASVVEPILTVTPSARALFAPTGKLPRPSERASNYGLAAALEDLASCGFAAGETGKAVLAGQAEAGHLSAEDLRVYAAIKRVPITIDVGGAAVHLNPLPAASGPLLAHSFRHLTSPGPVDIARALFATGQARRTSGGDLARLRTMPLRQKGTTHISVIDAMGNACAVTVSNGEGNGHIVGEFGFMMNNILGEEDVNPSGTQDWPENTRLSSMMSPAIVEKPDGGLIALGSGGSNRIRSAVFQTVIQLCLNGLDLESAILAPRVHLEGDHLDFEGFFEDAVATGLRELFDDHRTWPERNMFFGGVHAAMTTSDGEFAGLGDVRRDGIALVAH